MEEEKTVVYNIVIDPTDALQKADALMEAIERAKAAAADLNSPLLDKYIQVALDNVTAFAKDVAGYAHFKLFPKE